MKLLMIFPLLFLVAFTNFVSAQEDCKPFTNTTTSGPLEVTVYSEIGECFKIISKGEVLNEEYASRVVFQFPHSGKVQIEMEGGKTFKKTIMLAPEYEKAIYKIKKKIKKKGKVKYSMRLDLWNSGGETPVATTTEKTDAEKAVEAQMEKMKADQAKMSKDIEEIGTKKQEEGIGTAEWAEKSMAESDKDWDEKSAARKKEREASKAKDDEEKEARDAERRARWDADSEARRKKEKKIEKKEPVEPKVMGNTSKKESQASSIKSSGFGTKDTYKKNNKEYFESYSDGHEVNFYLTYGGKPVCNWDIELILEDENENQLVIAKGRTNSDGVFTSSYKGLLGMTFIVSGSRGGTNWSIGDYWFIAKSEINARKLEMEIKNYEEFIKKEMGDSPMGGMLGNFARYGLTSKCN